MAPDTTATLSPPPRPEDNVSFSTGLDRSATLPALQKTNSHDRVLRNSANSRASITRRRSSVFTESTDSLLLPLPTGTHNNRDREEQDPSHWHSAPLAFALLPAIGGLLFNNGSAVVTDLLLLALGAVFLNWSVRLPWHWYHSARAVRYVDSPPVPMNATYEESSGNEEVETTENGETTLADGEPQEQRNSKTKVEAEHLVAAKELQSHELIALALCFIGPLAGAYLLHAIRSQLSRPREGLVSDFNLTIFLLAAEFRPASHLITMMQERTLHLQRVVSRTQLDDSADSPQVQGLNQRVEELEARFVDVVDGKKSTKGKDTGTADITNHVRQNLQPQLDALNRAVRRYEKRATTQAMQTEARLQDLEARLRDALSLAAVAAQRSSKPGVIALALDWTSSLVMLPLQATWAVTMYPLQVAAAMIATVNVWAFGPPPEKRRKVRSSKGGDLGSRPRGRTSLGPQYQGPDA